MGISPTQHATPRPPVTASPSFPMAPSTAAPIATRASATRACATRTLPRASPSTITNGTHPITSLEEVSTDTKLAKWLQLAVEHRSRRAAAWTPSPWSDTRNRDTTRVAGTMGSTLLATTAHRKHAARMAQWCRTDKYAKLNHFTKIDPPPVLKRKMLEVTINRNNGHVGQSNEHRRERCQSN